MARAFSFSLAAALALATPPALGAPGDDGQETLQSDAGKRSCVEGVVWQPDNATIDPKGQWDKLGADTLLVQWTVVDGMAFVPGAGLPGIPKKPDWRRVAGEPWAKQVILGLAGVYSEPLARASVRKLVALSERIAALPTPLNVAGYYFPVEADPTWTKTQEFGRLLDSLPRPLWVSAYTAGDLDPAQFAEWVAGWLPRDVGLFFQDGVGAHGRTSAEATAYAAALAKRLGPSRVAVIVEAFRPAAGGGFRPATANELKPQIAATQAYRQFLFDGPHYVPSGVVDALACRR